jgi:hypothetical protein
MIERFFLYGVDMLGNYLAINQAPQSAVLILSHAADSVLIGFDMAVVIAEMAVHRLLLRLRVKHGFFHGMSSCSG